MTARVWAQIRKFLRSGDSYNREVFDWFKDADEFPKRKEVRDILLIGAKDSIQIAQVKMRSFREIIQKSHLKQSGDIVGIPKTVFDADVTYKPEVTLFFRQSKQATPQNKTSKTARVSYRLMNQSSSSLSKADLKALGKSIYDDFAKPGYRFNKGKIIAWYTQPEEGLHLQIYSHTEEIGETVVKKILQHRNLTFDEKFFKFTKPSRNSDPTPGNIVILGETKEKPVWRPTVFVEFTHAMINLHGDTQVRCLCDISGEYANPIYRPN
ncbi:hypothetical protein [Anabaena azotica]|uniref:Uncharacterized protein n=1 Tax=Anabaena azotica FACHB-119 TaxID=947527 RepID=A0ABR8D7J7_9NOST|nr:hypothetical protein [Anabaena azotica]MBD2503129.1 hypothetical protein [Anabaena azotica FACHB-119]